MYSYVLRRKGLYAVYAIFSVISSVTGVVFAFVLSEVLNAAVAGNEKRLLLNIVGGGLFVVISVGCSLVYGFAKNAVARNARYALKQDLFSAIFRRTVPEFEKGDTAAYLNTMTNNVNLFSDSYFANVLELPLIILSFLVSVILCIVIKPIMLLVILFFSVIAAAAAKYSGDLMQKSVGKYVQGMEQYTSVIKDDLQAFRLIRTYGAAKRIIAVHSNVNSEVERLKKNSSDTLTCYQCVNELIGVVSTLAIMGIAGFFAIHGDFEVGVVLAFGQLAGKIMSPVMNASNVLVSFRSVGNIRKEFQDILATGSQEEKGETSLEFAEKIELKELCFSYGEHSILDHASFRFEKGKHYAVTGESGSGKSSLLSLLAGIGGEYGGSILLDDTEWKSIGEDRLHSLVSLVSQESFLFQDTLKNNLTLFNDGYTEEQLNRALQAAGLENFVRNLPEGLNTVVSENGGNFSGGEKQRINLARALLRNSPILLLDEITANLDRDTAEGIERNLEALTDKTIIAVTHHLEQKDREKYHDVLRLQNGKFYSA